MKLLKLTFFVSTLAIFSCSKENLSEEEFNSAELRLPIGDSTPLIPQPIEIYDDYYDQEVDYVRTVSDIDGDGKNDIVGFGREDVLASLSDGMKFGSDRVWYAGYTDGWNNEDHVRVVKDVNGDGKSDIVGFGRKDVLVSLSNGNSFGTATVWNTGFAEGWRNQDHQQDYIRTIADVNGDGKSDIIGFGRENVLVSLSDGYRFGVPRVWNSGFIDGWNNEDHVRVVADVNGDGKADIVGFGNNSVLVSLSDGTRFGTPRTWTSGFTSGWRDQDHQQDYIRTIADVNGDGKSDIIGFGRENVLVALSDGYRFGAPRVWNSGFVTNWNNEDHVRIVSDVNGDGRADIIGFGNKDVLVSLSNGSSFGTARKWNSGFTEGWRP